MKRYFLFIMVLLFFSSAKAQVVQDFNSKYRLAQSFEQQGQLDKAASLFLEVYNEQPNNPIFLDALNRVYIKQKNYEASVQLLQNKIKTSPSDLTLYGLLGTTYFIMDQKDKAFEAWDDGVKSNSNSVTSYRLMANYAIENRAFDKAIEFLKLGKEKSPNPLIFSLDMANIYSAQMDFTHATKEYCELLSQQPGQISTVKSRILVYATRPGAVKQSIEAVNEFLDHSSVPVLYSLLFFLYEQDDDYDAALNAVTKYDDLIKAKGVQIFGFAQEAMRNKQYRQASKAYKLIIDNGGNSSLLSLARLGYTKTLEASIDEKYSDDLENWKPYKQNKIVGKEDYAQVVDAYNDLIKTNNNTAVRDEATFHIAQIYKDRLLDFQKADSLFKVVLKISPSTDYAIQSNIELGIIQIGIGKLEEAQNYFNTVLSNKRTDPNTKNEALFYLGKILFWSGKFGESLQKLNEVQSNLSTPYANDAISLSLLVNSSKNDSTELYDYAKADLLAEQNKIDKAIEDFKNLSEKTNSFVLKDLISFKYAELLIAQNSYPTALKILEKIANQSPPRVYSDKSMFLLGEIYQFAINDQVKAAENYQKLLETFPNSLYFDLVRERLTLLKTKNG